MKAITLNLFKIEIEMLILVLSAFCFFISPSSGRSVSWSIEQSEVSSPDPRFPKIKEAHEENSVHTDDQFSYRFHSPLITNANEIEWW